MAALAPHVAYLGIGGNQGDRVSLLRTAVAALRSFAAVHAVSSLYETPPWGYLNQPAFLNAALQITTGLDPEALLAALKQLERDLGREPGPRYGPRPVDIDILTYDDLLLHTSDLHIPHPHIAQRSFVLVPLAEIAPGLRLSPDGPTVAQLRDRREDRDQVQLVQREWVTE